MGKWTSGRCGTRSTRSAPIGPIDGAGDERGCPFLVTTINKKLSGQAGITTPPTTIDSYTQALQQIKARAPAKSCFSMSAGV